MFEFVVYLHDEGVLGLAEGISDGIRCEYYIDGVQYENIFEPDEYSVIIDL